MLFACSIVGHSEDDDGIAAKFPRTGAGEVFVSILYEDDTALDMVVDDVVGVLCPIVLGVFKAWVTRNLALCTALLDPLMEITLSVVIFDSGFPIVIWAPESSVMELILLPPLPITRPQIAFGAVN